MTSVDQDAIYQYSDGRDLLSAALMERAQLLRELEQLSKIPQAAGSPERIARFDLIRAQELVYELSILAERIDTLVTEINRYADLSGKPRVEVTAAKRK